jgi:hypothetical protein
VTAKSPRKRVDALFWQARLLRDVLRDALPAAHEKRYRRILGVKDEVQYGTRSTPPDEAQHLLEDLQAFARWAEDLLP